MKSVKYCLALVCALAISALPLFAQSAGGGSSTGKSAASSSSTNASGSTAASKSKSSSSGSKLDINTATADQLKALPGIDAATAQKIIAERPYHGKNDLVSKNIITKTEYDSIKDQIIAHHVQGASSTSAKGAPAKQ
jgi:DNA uptake protein ComE-like DNA-binding protein